MAKIKGFDAAQKKVDVAMAKAVEAQRAVILAEQDRDAIIEAQSNPEDLAHAVQAYQKSQKEQRTVKLAKKREIAKMLEEII